LAVTGRQHAFRASIGTRFDFVLYMAACSGAADESHRAVVAIEFLGIDPIAVNVDFGQSTYYLHVQLN